MIDWCDEVQKIPKLDMIWLSILLHLFQWWQVNISWLGSKERMKILSELSIFLILLHAYIKWRSCGTTNELKIKLTRQEVRTRTITKSSMSSLFVFHTLSNDVSCGIRWLFPMNLTNHYIRNGFCWFHHWQWDQFSSEYYRIFAAPKEFVASWPKKKCVIQSNTREKSQ